MAIMIATTETKTKQLRTRIRSDIYARIEQVNKVGEKVGAKFPTASVVEEALEKALKKAEKEVENLISESEQEKELDRSASVEQTETDSYHA